MVAVTCLSRTWGPPCPSSFQPNTPNAHVISFNLAWIDNRRTTRSPRARNLRCTPKQLMIVAITEKFFLKESNPNGHTGSFETAGLRNEPLVHNRIKFYGRQRLLSPFVSQATAVILYMWHLISRLIQFFCLSVSVTQLNSYVWLKVVLTED